MAPDAMGLATWRPGHRARIPSVHYRYAMAGRGLALGVLFVAPLLLGGVGTAHAQATRVSLSVSPDAVGESAGATTLTVVGTLHGGTFGGNTPVALTVSAGTASETDDYVAGTATLTILAGETVGTAMLTLTPADDDIDEDDETVIVEGTVTGLEVTPDTVTITDNDTSGITVSPRVLGCTRSPGRTIPWCWTASPRGRCRWKAVVPTSGCLTRP